MTLAELEAQAAPEAVALARSILEHSIDSRRWSAHIGPALSQVDTARLLRKTPQAVSQDRRLVRVINSDGRPVYPLFQFHRRQQIAGVGDVVSVLAGVLDSLSLAAWFASDNLDLGRRPIDLLGAGDDKQVLRVANQLATRLG